MNIKIILNGERKTIADGLTITNLLETLEQNPQDVAMAVNGEFVPKSNYTITKIKNGDSVEILSPMGGG